MKIQIEKGPDKHQDHHKEYAPHIRFQICCGHIHVNQNGNAEIDQQNLPPDRQRKCAKDIDDHRLCYDAGHHRCTGCKGQLKALQSPGAPGRIIDVSQMPFFFLIQLDLVDLCTREKGKEGVGKFMIYDSGKSQRICKKQIQRPRPAEKPEDILQHEGADRMNDQTDKGQDHDTSCGDDKALF